MHEYFDQIVCINLDRRHDRWETFQARLQHASWPFRPVERICAIDAQKTGVPPWWKGPIGAWGCYRSHVQILENALNNDVNSILVLEDDVILPARCDQRIAEFLSKVPDDWDQIYFGGKYADGKHPISEDVIRAFGVILTHAYAIRQPFIQQMYHHLCTKEHMEEENGPWHVDMQMAKLHQDSRYHIYCPQKWLMRQTFRTSDIRT